MASIGEELTMEEAEEMLKSGDVIGAEDAGLSSASTIASTSIPTSTPTTIPTCKISNPNEDENGSIDYEGNLFWNIN